MKFHTTLSEFNQRIADKVRDLFPKGVTPQQGDDGRLYFRGPSPNTGAHFVVYLEPDVQPALDQMSPKEREEHEGYLIESLVTQIRVQYKPTLDRTAREVPGTLKMLHGE